MCCFVKIFRRLFGVVVIIPLTIIMFAFGSVLLCLSFIELFFEYIITGTNKCYNEISNFVIFDIPETISEVFNIITGKEE